METRGENAKLKQFLLGNPSQQPEDAEEIGVRIIADRNFDEKISFAEEELIEDFLDDALTAEEKELFYVNFLTTPERVELFEETALLRNYARTHFAEASENLTDEKKSGSFFESLRLFLSSNLVRPIAAVLIILVIGAVVWRVAFYDANGLTQIEKDYAALNAKDLNNAPEIANLTNKSLAAGTFRDTDSAATLNAANLTEKVLFRLALPPAAAKDTLLNLELVKGGQTVFRQTDLRVYQNQNGQELKVVLPKTVLSKGTYQIKLSNGVSYGFAVE
jgi:hypothetical protein